MKLAVMQPYLFPYIGYFQLIYAADMFLIYDDVAFMKKGYINRNNILSANGVVRFTLPVPGASQNKLISTLSFSTETSKILKTIEHSYAKAPFFDAVFPIIRDVLESPTRDIASVCERSFKAIFTYLGIDKAFQKTSELNYDRSLSARDRLITLSQMYQADTYINAAGGRELYSKEEFQEHGINLQFIDSISASYEQNSEEFIPNLSIIDVLMNCSKNEVYKLLKSYELN